MNRQVAAVEQSETMVRQRSENSSPAMQANAENLPFEDNAFDTSLAILTAHHWSDQNEGLRKLRRVSCDRTVILTWDPAAIQFWLLDYFPEILEIDQQIFPSIKQLELALGSTTITTLPIPHDCTDGFLGAYWRRPTAYLDEHVRSAISTF
ncbi:MAG: class I SAM-dependent methyltransferase [Gammaproteobacteria bacterium]|nr:class I SAM-dependent methyltransferase [Gammaproteobacteria bacterium]